MNISPDDVAELGQLLQFLDDWLAACPRHCPVDESLTRFVGCDAYDIESLRDDLARFTFLLGENDGEGLFSARTRLNKPAAIPSLAVANTVSSS